MMMRIRELRKQKGMDGKTLAEKVGVTPAAISNYELGQREPSYEMLLKIAEELDTTVDYLLEKTDNPSQFDWPGVDGEILMAVLDLTPTEKERVLAFIAGLKANRR